MNGLAYCLVGGCLRGMVTLRPIEMCDPSPAIAIQRFEIPAFDRRSLSLPTHTSACPRTTAPSDRTPSSVEFSTHKEVMKKKGKRRLRRG